MRRFVVALLAASAISVSAYAADMSVKAPPPAPVAINWTGFYVGGHAGLAAGNYDWTFVGNGSTTSHNFSQFAGGAQLGFNYQIGQWVLGIEGSGTWGDMNGESTCPNPAATCRSEKEWLAAATGRIGYAWTDFLFYGKGGAAWTDNKFHVLFPAGPALNESASGQRTGWTVGAGLEYAFWKDWSARIEYDYYDFGTQRVDFTRDATGAFVETADIKNHVHTVMVGVNYRFSGWFR